MKKKLLALLLCLTMLLVMLPTVALAEGEGEEVVPEGTLTTRFVIEKQVVKGGTATPPAATFTFDLKDTAEANHRPDSYGISIRDDLSIETNGDGAYLKTINVWVDQDRITENDGWMRIDNSNTLVKSFYISERTGNEEGWEYSTQSYDQYRVIFRYNPDNTYPLICEVCESNNDVTFRTANFTNRYTANSSTIIIVPETTEAAPNPTTGAAPANLGLGCVVIGLAAMGAVAYARKK